MINYVIHLIGQWMHYFYVTELSHFGGRIKLPIET